MGTINQVNNFQNSENDNGQNFTNANIINQTNNIFASSVEEIYVSLNLSQEQKNKINQDKYLKDFKDAFQYLNIETNSDTDFSNYDFNLDFYFNFLVELTNTDNIFAFSNELNKFLNEYILIKSDIGLDTESLLIFLNENSEEKIKEEALQKEIDDNSITKKSFEYINNALSFIEKWEYDMYLFVYYLTKTDFELFINSNNKDLLYHAIGFLVYSSNDDREHNLIFKVNYVYDYLKKNQHKTNKEAIKNILSNFDEFIELQIKEKEDFFMKKFGEFPHTIHKQEKLLSELQKNILKKEEIKTQKLELQKKLNQIEKELKKIKKDLTN